MTTTQLEWLITKLRAEREAICSVDHADGEGALRAYIAAIVECDALIYSAKVALGERRAHRGDSRAAAMALCRAAWDERHPPITEADRGKP